MTLTAGIDIGNSTTEVVLGRSDGSQVEVVASGRVPTRGIKGEQASIRAAARLTARLAAEGGAEIDQAVVAPVVPVRTDTETTRHVGRPTGRLAVALRHADTVHGEGIGVGRPLLLGPGQSTDGPGTGPRVVLVPRSMGYRESAHAVDDLYRDGVDIAAVLIERDEAVLVGHRLSFETVIVDRVDVAAVATAKQVAVETRQSALRSLNDVFWIVATFSLGDDERAHAKQIAEQLFDASCAVLTLGATSTASDDDATDSQVVATDWADLHEVGLDVVARVANSQRGAFVTDETISARLALPTDRADVRGELAQALGVDVLLAESEAAAALLGGLSTPGCPPDAAVVDVGGGTIDLAGTVEPVVVAGAGIMLTSTTARALTVSTSAADYVKRGASVRIVAPQITEDESGGRAFLDSPIGPDAIGWLCSDSPAGIVRISSRLTPAEWRSWRRAAKRLVIGANVERALSRVDATSDNVLVAGGGAGDDEIVAAVSEALGGAISVGRANVGGMLGHRYAVAYGLVAYSANRETARP